MPIRPVIGIRTIDPPGVAIELELADGFATPAFDAGWQTVSRPRDTGFVSWTGDAPITMDVPVMKDKLASGNSVEPWMTQLYRMMAPQGRKHQPPVLIITGVPIPFRAAQWVLTNVAPSEEIRRESDGMRIRVVMTLSFLRYLPGDITLHRNTSVAKRAKKAASKYRTYVCKKGDTLKKIAAKKLGKASRWHEIAKINHLRAGVRLKVGQKLKIPKS